MGSGTDIIAVAKRCVKQKYLLGVLVPKNNSNWSGPWDCAEFVSWCAYQTYGLTIGMRPRQVDKGDAYSGFWFEDAGEPGAGIPVKDALRTAGAILVRKPRSNLIGHVAISLGDGRHTIEARSSKLGVDVFDGAADRPWDIGMRLPGVEYDGAAVSPGTERPRVKPLPKSYFAERRPPQTGAAVMAIQMALKAKHFDPGPLDGEFGRMTATAVGALQAMEGVEVDGIVGPNTAKALGLSFPITPSKAATEAWTAQFADDQAPLRLVSVAGTDAAALTIVRFVQDGTKHSVEFSDGTIRFVGSEVNYSDDMPRRGLWQDKDLSRISDVGRFDPADFAASHGQWAHFVAPTIGGESAGYFGRLNSYDRAAFTFGAPQFAAHTPDENLILLMRKLLREVPATRTYFPELSLVGGKVTLTKPDGSTVDLERAEKVTRPNGTTESQAKRFMDYLNADPAKVRVDEIAAGARLLQLTKAEPAARVAQIDVLVDRARRLIARAKTTVPAFTGKDWRQAVWIFDITYQGRGTYSAIAAALSSPNPLKALSEIGGSYVERRRSIKAAVVALEKSRVLDGFEV